MAFIYESFSIQKVWTKGPLTLRQYNGNMSSFIMKPQQACKALIWEDDPYKKMARRLANWGDICLFVWVFSLLLNIWGHITTVPPWSCDTLTKMLLHRKACHRHMTWHPTPSQYTDMGLSCRCAINWSGTSHRSTQLPIWISWGKTQPWNPSWPSTHTSQCSNYDIGPSFSKHLKSVFVAICWARKIEIVITSWNITVKHPKLDILNLGWFSSRKTKYWRVWYTSK